MKSLVLVFASLLMLGGCAQKQHTSSKDSGELTLDGPSSASATVKKVEKPATKEEPAKSIVVNPTDLDLVNKMNKAMENFVYKNQKDEFTKLCGDKHFDCVVNDKSFPAKKKKIARKVPPYMSGSKNGLQGEDRVQVKYDFYP